MTRPQNHDLPTIAIACAFIALASGWVLFVTGCGYAKHKNPPLYLESSAAAAQEAARLHARDIGGIYHENLCCGSMRPTIQTHDWIVTLRTPWRAELLGRIVQYRVGPGTNYLHRLVSGNATSGFIASGDNNPYSESGFRVTADNYVDEAVAIYREAPR